MKSSFLHLVIALVFQGLAYGAALPEWPVPPKQQAPWLAPANVPTNLISAAQAVFAQGFPDPRECDYREIEAVTSSVQSPTPLVVKTHGWVLPVSSSTTQRHAIAWNGVIYPVVKAGEKADLKADIAGLNR
jgi:hypothetical protein